MLELIATVLGVLALMVVAGIAVFVVDQAVARRDLWPTVIGLAVFAFTFVVLLTWGGWL